MKKIKGSSLFTVFASFDKTLDEDDNYTISCREFPCFCGPCVGKDYARCIRLDVVGPYK